MKNVLKLIVFSFLFLSTNNVGANGLEVDATTRVVESIKSNEETNYREISKQVHLIEDNIKNGKFKDRRQVRNTQL